MVFCQLVCQNHQTQERIALQFLRDMKPVFAQTSGTRRKGRNQANFHSSPVVLGRRFDVDSQADVAAAAIKPPALNCWKYGTSPEGQVFAVEGSRPLRSPSGSGRKPAA